MPEAERKYEAGACPWCKMPPAEHEQRDGHMFRNYLCDNAPPGWRGVFVDEPVAVDKGRRFV
jgi:hypothetical protein